MSEQAAKVLEQALGLSEEDRRWVADRLVNGEPPPGFGMEGVPQEIIDDELAEVEARMAAHEANPQPMATADEAFARIFARLEARRANQ